jgi:hypothetical protein
MFLGLLLTAGTLLSFVLMGTWFDSSDLTTINALSVTKDVDFFSLVTISVPNIDYFAVGVTRMIQFDFGFFGGGFAIIQWLLIMTLGAATVWGIFTVVITIGTNLLSGRH